jgi:hypothetical protein
VLGKQNPIDVPPLKSTGDAADGDRAFNVNNVAAITVAIVAARNDSRSETLEWGYLKWSRAMPCACIYRKCRAKRIINAITGVGGGRCGIGVLLNLVCIVTGRAKA